MKGSWHDLNSAPRVESTNPSPRDVCVVTLLEGRRVAIEPISNWEEAVSKAKALVERTKRPVKVLAMRAEELMDFLGLTTADLPTARPTMKFDSSSLAPARRRSTIATRYPSEGMRSTC
jgi:hypothetical protein